MFEPELKSDYWMMVSVMYLAVLIYFSFFLIRSGIFSVGNFSSLVFMESQRYGLHKHIFFLMLFYGFHALFFSMICYTEKYRLLGSNLDGGVYWKFLFSFLLVVLCHILLAGVLLYSTGYRHLFTEWMAMEQHHICMASVPLMILGTAIFFVSSSGWLNRILIYIFLAVLGLMEIRKAIHFLFVRKFPVFVYFLYLCTAVFLPLYLMLKIMSEWL